MCSLHSAMDIHGNRSRYPLNPVCSLEVVPLHQYPNDAQPLENLSRSRNPNGKVGREQTFKTNHCRLVNMYNDDFENSVKQEAVLRVSQRKSSDNTRFITRDFDRG